MGKVSRELWLFTKAEVSASMASIVDFGLAIGLTVMEVLPYSWANIIGVVSGGVTNCSINYKYVFKNSGRKKKSVFMRYLLVWSGSLMLNGGGTILITSWLGEKYFIIVKSCMALAVALSFNYPLQRIFVFKINKNNTI
jgi:putative flippase GtrA